MLHRLGDLAQSVGVDKAKFMDLLALDVRNPVTPYLQSRVYHNFLFVRWAAELVQDLSPETTGDSCWLIDVGMLFVYVLRVELSAV